MGISFSHGQVVMAEQLLDCVEVHAGHYEPAGKSVARIMPSKIIKSCLYHPGSPLLGQIGQMQPLTRPGKT